MGLIFGEPTELLKLFSANSLAISGPLGVEARSR